MPSPLRAAASLGLTAALTLAGVVPVIAAAPPPPKVVIIVGPTGGQTDFYRDDANDVADAAEAAGANVVKVYSPEATWQNVMDAVDGANIVVYMGHGNGFPSPYSSTENTDRVNGWGLNRTENGGDADNWSTTMVYCGEKALLGTLTSSDGAAQRQYCAGGPITPAPNWVMIYAHACYAPGASEGWDTPATESVAFQRVRNYSYPALKRGAGAYYATDMHNGAPQLVTTILENPGMAFGEIGENANGWQLLAQRRFDHPDIAGARVWLQATGSPPNYWWAFAGHIDRTPSGATVDYEEPPLPPPPSVVSRTPSAGATGVATTKTVRATFDRHVVGVGGSSFFLRDVWGVKVPASVSYDSDTLRATLTPSSPLHVGYRYQAVLTSAIEGPEGIPLAQTTWFFRVTGESDAPPAPSSALTYSPALKLTLAAGSVTGYTFNGSGALIGYKTITVGATTKVDVSQRRTISNQSGTWFLVSSGSLAGYWIREGFGAYLHADVRPDGPGGAASWNPARGMTFLMGTHTGYQFNASGAVTSTKTYTLGGASGAATSQRAPVTNQFGRFFYVTNGVWAGYWIRDSDVVYLTP